MLLQCTVACDIGFYYRQLVKQNQWYTNLQGKNRVPNISYRTKSYISNIQKQYDKRPVLTEIRLMNNTNKRILCNAAGVIYLSI